MKSVVLCLTPAEDVMMETVVEVSTECGPIEEESFPIPPDCEPAAKKKRGGGQCHHNKSDETCNRGVILSQDNTS